MEFIHQYNGLAENGTKNYFKAEAGLNEATLTINSTVNYPVHIYAQLDECYKCDLVKIKTAAAENVTSFPIEAVYGTELHVVREFPEGFKSTICKFHEKFREKGDYWIFVDNAENNLDSECSALTLANDPDTAELPILYLFLGLLGLAILYAAGKYVYRLFRKHGAKKRNSLDLSSGQDGINSISLTRGKGHGDDPEATERSEEEPPKIKQRLRSLDTFRGFTLMLMIFVNYGGGGYWFFEHSPWNGLYVADLVFPWFVFIMGVSMNFSFKSMFKKNWPVWRITWRVFSRSLKIFVIGFMLGTVHWVADMDTVRILSVLQRLALTYFISSMIHFLCVRRFDSHQDRRWAPVRDLVLYSPEWAVNLVILALHLCLIYALPVPGCPTGYVGPGGLSEGGKYYNCTGGATQYIDRLILGTNHMYQWPTPQHIYKTVIPFDPEGFLGTLNCVFLCFLGIQCGRIVLIYQQHKQRVVRFLIWAVVLGAIAALLTKCSQEDGFVPLNKNIWSVSYSLACASFAYVLLCAMYVIIDVFSVWKGQPFIYLGMNSIVMYVCHDVFYKTFPVNFVVPEDHLSLLLRCAWATACWLIVAYWLYVKKIFIAL